MKELQREYGKPTLSLQDLATHAGVRFKKEKAQTCSDWESELLNEPQQVTMNTYLPLMSNSALF